MINGLGDSRAIASLSLSRQEVAIPGRSLRYRLFHNYYNYFYVFCTDKKLIIM
ncbi:hypothetical protein [Anabaena sp. AL93]|uniref:hypothetical protein n=1 Tax=Anabaena sp. AL93 TaxID=1678133 RepID=UPI0025B81679|nr:hypothetical protein [Anabaena sp. AL93]